ncbi:MAG: radical SAM protein [Moorellales bacterium]
MLIRQRTVHRFLASRPVRYCLRRLAARDASGRALLDRILAEVAGVEKRRWSHVFFYLFALIIRLLLKIPRRRAREEIFANPTYRRALVNLARSVARYGPTMPQIFAGPLLVVWNFTNACNLRCRHCYQEAGRHWEDELSLEEQIRIVEELAANDVPMLAFSGGEPLLNPNFWPVAERAARLGFYVSVATNGTLVTPEVAQRLREVGVRYVEISLDSAEPEKHDAFRGVPGYWQRAVEGIKNCVATQGLRVGLAPTVTRQNFHELPRLLDLARELGVDLFYAFNFVPTGRGRQMAEEDLAPSEREQFLELLYRTLLRREIGVFCTAPQFGRFCVQKAPESVVITSHYTATQGKYARIVAEYVGGCGAGRCYCAVQPNGDVTPCVFLPLVIGNLRSQTLAEIWEHSPVLAELRDRSRLRGHCGTCTYRSLCGGCRARAYGYYRDYLAPDPGCINNLRYWEELSRTHPTSA